MMTRYLVRRAGGKATDVYIWTKELYDRGDLEEVYAENAQEALLKDSMPDPKNMTLAQLEAMKKVDLIVFGKVRFGLDLKQELTVAQLQDEIKQAWFSTPLAGDDSVKPAVVETARMAAPADARRSPGA